MVQTASTPIERQSLTVAVVGLGYVGLPVAIAFNRAGVPTIGFDVDNKKIGALKKGLDITGELSPAELAEAKTILYTDNPNRLKTANFFIVAVPTPVTRANTPDLSLVESASRMVGQNLSKNSYVVFESTVYPGVTEDICRPILERESGLKSGRDFFLGYSPERINPGDKEHTLETIVKVVAGDSSQSARRIAGVYAIICRAGVHIAPTIKTAEAAKVIENTQRDLNIALMNELSLIFHRLDINTYDVLDAAGTKWNFLKFTPGLVGGHCIGVDPYYLVHKAEELGYHPQVIAAGRRVNDTMSSFVAQMVITNLIKAQKNIHKAKILVVGLTFKEDVTDIRNSKIKDTIEELKRYKATVVGHDPLLDRSIISNNFDIAADPNLKGVYDAIIFATPHTVVQSAARDFIAVMNRKTSTVVLDLKRRFPEFEQLPRVVYLTL